MASEGVRERNVKGKQANGGSTTTHVTSKKAGGISVVDVLRILGGLFLLNCLLSYFITNDSVLWGWRPWFVRPNEVSRYFVSPDATSDVKARLANTTYSKDQSPLPTPSSPATMAVTPASPSISR